jgi:hypothetical protein
MVHAQDMERAMELVTAVHDYLPAALNSATGNPRLDRTDVDTTWKALLPTTLHHFCSLSQARLFHSWKRCLSPGQKWGELKNIKGLPDPRQKGAWVCFERLVRVSCLFGGILWVGLYLIPSACEGYPQ